METDSSRASQRRAINLVWTACGDYQFEPQFLALKADGTPDFYMNCVIGLVRKWLGDEMPRRLFALWADDTRRSAFDDLAWLALENAVYEKELPVRAVLTELRRAHAAEFFASEYQLSRQEWMDKNQLVYSLQSARWRSVLGQTPPLLAPREKGLSEALACPGTLDADDLEAAVRAAFEKYLQFDGTPHKKSPFRLHFSDRWAPLLTKLLPVEIVRTDELTVGRSAVAGENGMVRASTALRAQLRSNAREASAASAAAAIPRRRSRAASSAAAPASTSAAISGSPAASACRASPCVPTRSAFSSRPPSRPSATAPPTSATAHCIRTLSCA